MPCQDFRNGSLAEKFFYIYYTFENYYNADNSWLTLELVCHEQ